jgi:DNA-binding PadR family transcriptional regulator
MFGRGDLKYALLQLLRERPKHGYEMIKELEERSGGFYTPSAGAIYPTLQLLEDRGWVTVETVEGKKVYAITDPGKAALAERGERSETMGGPGFWSGPRHGPFGREMRPELRALRHEGLEVARLLRAAVMVAHDDPERLARLRAIIVRTRDDLNGFLGQGQAHAAESPGSPAGSSAEGPVERL